MPPNIRGVMDRRLLANYRVDADALDAVLPEPFRSRDIGGKGIGSVCLMRIEGARPRFAPGIAGIDVETATHRISVEHERNGVTVPAVYVPRRDVSSRLHAALADAVMPGELGCADFEVDEDDRHGEYEVCVDCDTEFVRVRAHRRGDGKVDDGSVFDRTEDASEFFCEAGTRYSCVGGVHEAVEMRAREWGMEPLEPREVRSSFFERLNGAEVDSVFLMRGIEHEWRSRPSLAKP